MTGVVTLSLKEHPNLNMEEVCNMVQAHNEIKYEVIPNVFNIRLKTSKVILISQLSYDRLDRLDVIANSWKGLVLFYLESNN